MPQDNAAEVFGFANRFTTEPEIYFLLFQFALLVGGVIIWNTLITSLRGGRFGSGLRWLGWGLILLMIQTALEMLMIIIGGNVSGEMLSWARWLLWSLRISAFFSILIGLWKWLKLTRD